MVLDMKPLLAEQAKQRQIRKPNSVTPPEGGTKGETRQQLAKMAKVSKSSIDYAEYIKAHAPAVAIFAGPPKF